MNRIIDSGHPFGLVQSKVSEIFGANIDKDYQGKKKIFCY
jgi:hypothetical protein